MSTLNELIEQIENPELRKRIADEVTKLNKQKKFGLVFEEHVPECTPLYDIPVKKGALVMVKGGNIKELYYVRAITDGNAECVKKDGSETVTMSVDSLVSVAQFGEPIYPYLKPLDSICNAPDSDLWHTLIEADNYHALQLLEYLYAGKVDCIYIDPPYNKEDSKDWKYNCNYVDSNDQYRHSKWLSMMQKRLKLAKKLLNPKDSVLIVTIDEEEYLHLGCLLEEMFPEANMQMVSSAISRGGSSRKNQFGRCDEYLFFIQFGESSPQRLQLSDEWKRNPNDKRAAQLKWYPLVRQGSGAKPTPGSKLVYPIFISLDRKHFVGAGMPLRMDEDKNEVVPPANSETVWPYRSDGSDGHWSINREKFLDYMKKGYVRLGENNKKLPALSYMTESDIVRVETGIYAIDGRREDGSIISNSEHSEFVPTTQWKISTHDASAHGTDLIKAILTDNRFSYPKSLYAVHDAIRFFVANKPNALIIDFFAGSGTTLHAVNLLNAEDGGHRRCILVTNNEMKKEEEDALLKKGVERGSDEWNALGIARYVTWPRTVCSIEGHDVNGNPLKGNYIGSDIPMADGFKANANFFKLGFLDKTRVSLGMQFAEMLPTLWMKAGAIGECPSLDGKSVPEMLILPKNKMAILNNENQFAAFAEELAKYPEIEAVYLVTDYEASFVSMTNDLPGRTTYQLYRDYLDNFRINAGRNAR